METTRHIGPTVRAYLDAALLVFLLPMLLRGMGTSLFLPIEIFLRNGVQLGFRVNVLDVLVLLVTGAIVAWFIKKGDRPSQSKTREARERAQLVVTPRRLGLGFLLITLSFVSIATPPTAWLTFFATRLYHPSFDAVGAEDTVHFGYLLLLIGYAAFDTRGRAVLVMLSIYLAAALWPFVDQIATSTAALYAKGRANNTWDRRSSGNYRLHLKRYSGSGTETELDCEVAVELRSHAQSVLTDSCKLERRPVDQVFYEIEKAFIFGERNLLAVEATYDPQLGFPVETTFYHQSWMGSGLERTRLPERREVPHDFRIKYTIEMSPL